MIASAPSFPSRTARPVGERQQPVAAPTRFLGRQPILDVNLRIFGYQLLLSSGRKGSPPADPTHITREVVDHWLILLPDACPGAAFVPCTREALIEGVVTLLPPANTILEISEHRESDAELITTCLSLKERGYRFALRYLDPRQPNLSLLACADFIKADFPASGFQLRHEIAAIAAASRAQLIAENIENEIQMRIAHGEGWSLLQGYFFSHPIPLPPRPLPQNHLLCLKLLAALQRGPADLRKLEKLISTDASLCYRVLRLANSALQGHPGTINTIREALLLVGDLALRRMITAAVAGMLASQRNPALVSMTVVRARFCELLAPHVSADPAQFYLLGMLSLLDILLATSLDRILETIPVSAAMKSSLLGDQSPAGLILGLLRALETCDWPRCEQIQDILGISEGIIAASYVESLHWTSAMIGEGALP